MNYLSHALLSGPNDEILTGNMMGDSVKGNTFNTKYSKSISDGIVLHRFIDNYMDTHPLIKIGKKRIWPNYRHYAGVVMDLYYDHLLAKNWSRFSDISIDEFAQETYHRLEIHWDVMPEEAKMVIGHMIRKNWLGNYNSLEALTRTFQNMSKRTKFISHMETAVDDLSKYYEVYNDEFLSFFEEMKIENDLKLKSFQNG